MTLPNHWNLFGLRSSAYFQATLGESDSEHPITLFVGRTQETKSLLNGIGGSGSSRQAIGGAPGIGKTTLVQVVKATALSNDYWTTDGVITFYADDTAERVMGRVLEAIYEAILTARPHTAQNKTMQVTQQYVRAFRLGGGSANISILGVGAGGSRTVSAVTPPAGLLIDGPRLIRELLELAMSNSKGVVIHLDNLENLTERELANAADILRSLRDTVLLQEGLHVLLVGTTDAVTGAVTAHPQLRSVFSIHIIEPMPVKHVQALLGARYEHLRLSADRSVTPPVAPATVAALYPLFRGDLRELLKVLEDGGSLLAGVVAPQPDAPITLDALRPALKQRYGDELAATLKQNRQRQLTQWVERLGASGTPTQDQLARTWKITQPGVSQTLKDLGQAGYVMPLPRRSGEATTYALAGRARLIFD